MNLKTTRMVCGIAAVELARRGAQLMVRGFAGWVPAGGGALSRIERMPAHALWIYGVAVSK